MLQLLFCIFILGNVLVLSGQIKKPLAIGNFALSEAFQPSPLFSFGQNTINKNDAIAYISPVYEYGKHRKSFYNNMYFLYGLTDSASIFGLIPAPVFNKEYSSSTSGIGDFIIQGEYAYINTATDTTQTQATIVGSIYLPAGILEASKQGPNFPVFLSATSFGVTSFFLGGTYSYMTSDWYAFTSLGGLLIPSHNKSKLGNILFYQAGIGRNLKHLKDQVLLLLFECDGIRTNQDKYLGMLDPNSGSNIIFLGPVLYYATKRTIFQIGIQAPVYQKLKGLQPKTSYLFSVSFAYLLNHDTYD